MKDFMYRIRKCIAVVLVFALVAGLMPLSGLVPMETRAYEELGDGDFLGFQDDLSEEFEEDENDDGFIKFSNFAMGLGADSGDDSGYQQIMSVSGNDLGGGDDYDQGGHNAGPGSTDINFQYKIDGKDDAEWVNRVRWWGIDNGRSKVEIYMPSNLVINESFELLAGLVNPSASVMPSSKVISFTNNIGKAEFTVVSEDKTNTTIYDVTVKLIDASNTNIYTWYSYLVDDFASEGGWWLAHNEVLDILYANVAPDANLDVTVSAEDEEAFVKCESGKESKSSHKFKVQLKDGKGQAKVTITSADRTESKEYTVFLMVRGYESPKPTLESLVIKGNGGANIDLKWFNDGWGEQAVAYVPYHITTVTDILYEVSEGAVVEIGIWKQVSDNINDPWEFEILKTPFALGIDWNWFDIYLRIPGEPVQASYHIQIIRDPVFKLDGDGSPPEDTLELDEEFLDEIKDDVKVSVGSNQDGEDVVVIELDVTISKADLDGNTAIAKESIKAIWELLHEIKNDTLENLNADGVKVEINAVIEVEVKPGFTVSIDLGSITDPDAVKDVDLNFGIIPVTSGTQFRNDDTNTKVTVPANSIVIAPPTHGSYGFEVSFIISETELKAMGLKGNNIKLYYLDEFGIPRQLGNNSKLERNSDGSVTITISGASIYILINDDEDFTIEPIIPPSDKKTNDQTNQTSKTKKSSSSTPVSNFGSSSEATKNWGNVGGDLNAKLSAGIAFNHVVHTGTDIIVPAQIFNTLSGTSGTVMLNTGTGVTFSLSGGNIPTGFNPVKFDLSLNKAGLKAPANKVAAIKAGSVASIDIPMVSSEKFGMPVGMHFNVGAANAGKFANLFRFNESSGEFEYLGSFPINDKGQAMFGISGGADYVLTVTATKPNLPIVSVLDSNTYTVRPGDTLGRIASRFGMRLQQLLILNPQISNPNRIRVGQVIRVQ